MIRKFGVKSECKAVEECCRNKEITDSAAML